MTGVQTCALPISTQYGLGNKQFCFATSIEKLGSIDVWDEITKSDEQGRSIKEGLEGLMKDIRASIVKDLEPAIPWIREPNKMYHIETFNATPQTEELEEFFIERAFPYLRDKGFHVKLFKTIHELGPSDYWFITEMDSFSSLDQWPQMAAGDPKGIKIMERLIDIIDVPRATIIKELPATIK